MEDVRQGDRQERSEIGTRGARERREIRWEKDRGLGERELEKKETDRQKYGRNSKVTDFFLQNVSNLQSNYKINEVLINTV